MAKHLALVQPKSKRPEFTGVVMPYKPPVDKIAALVLFQSINELPLAELKYWKRNECPPEQFALWRDERYYPIDIGDRKYHESGVASATEFVAKEFGIELSPGHEKLLSLINENNKRGTLKNAKLAVPHILRKMYELSDDPDSHIRIINRATDVIAAFVRVEDGEVAQAAEGLAEALPQLVEQLKICNNAPLTLGRYAQDLWVLGEDPVTINEKVSFWLSGWDDVQDRKARCKEQFAKMQPDWFEVKKKKGIVLRSDDRFLGDAVSDTNEYAIRIIVGSDGNTTISAYGLDLSKVAEELQAREPGRWYYQRKMSALINGGPQYVGVTPTKLRPSRLIGLLQEKLIVPSHKK